MAFRVVDVLFRVHLRARTAFTGDLPKLVPEATCGLGVIGLVTNPDRPCLHVDAQQLSALVIDDQDGRWTTDVEMADAGTRREEETLLLTGHVASFVMCTSAL